MPGKVAKRERRERLNKGGQLSLQREDGGCTNSIPVCSKLYLEDRNNLMFIPLFWISTDFLQLSNHYTGSGLGPNLSNTAKGRACMQLQ